MKLAIFVLLVFAASCTTAVKKVVADPPKDLTVDNKHKNDNNPHIKDPPFSDLPFTKKDTTDNKHVEVIKNEHESDLSSALEFQKNVVAKNPTVIEKKRLALLYLAEGKLLEAEKIMSIINDPNEKLLKFIWPMVLNELGEFKQAQEKLYLLADELPSSKVIKIERTELCRRIQGFRRYELYGEGGKIKPGGAALIYLEVKNFTSQKSGDANIMHLKYDWELFDDRDRKILVTAWDKADQKHKEDRIETRGITREFYQSFRLPLPKNLATGNYKIKISVEDASSGKSDSTFVPIYVTDY